MHDDSVENDNHSCRQITAPRHHELRRRAAVALWSAQVLATVVGVAACAAEIETILFTGPALALIGLNLALVTRPLRSWRVIVYSLSAPIMSAFCATLIAVFRWGPNEAEDPILVIFFIYAFVSIPIALIVFPVIFQWSTMLLSWPPFPWQYSLKSLLLVTSALCVVIAALRFLLIHITGNDGIIFSAYVLVTMGLVGILLLMFAAGRDRH
jgi:hypothetical protein